MGEKRQLPSLLPDGSGCSSQVASQRNSGRTKTHSTGAAQNAGKVEPAWPGYIISLQHTRACYDSHNNKISKCTHTPSQASLPQRTPVHVHAPRNIVLVAQVPARSPNTLRHPPHPKIHCTAAVEPCMCQTKEAPDKCVLCAQALRQACYMEGL